MNEETLLVEITLLKEKLREKETQLIDLRRKKQILQSNGLNNTEIARYSRQMILQYVKVEGKLKFFKKLLILITIDTIIFVT